MICKKELYRLFTDKRMLAAVFLPGIIIYVIYSCMGSFIPKMFGPEENKHYIAYYQTDTQEFTDQLNSIIDDTKYNIELKQIDENITMDQAKEAITNKEAIFIVTYTKASSESLPAVDYYYNTQDIDTAIITDTIFQKIQNISIKDVNFNFIFNGNADINYDLSEKGDNSAIMSIIGKFVPFLLLILISTTSIGFIIENVAGEKERGNFATYLLTPIKNSQLALGKVISYAIISVASTLVSTIGVLLSFPKLISQGQQEIPELNLSMMSFTPGMIALFLLCAVLLVLMFSTIFLFISCLSNSVKEANSYASFVMIITMLLSAVSFLSSRFPAFTYAIPILGQCKYISDLFLGNIQLVPSILALGVPVIFISVLVFVLSKLFNNEKVIFTN